MGKSKAKKKTNQEELNKTKKYKIKASKKNKNDNNNKKNKKKHRILKRVILTIFALILLLILIGAGIIAGIFFSDKFKLTEDDLTIKNLNGNVLDKDGNIVATLSGKENRKIVSTEDMTEYLPKAFIAIEDKRFYEHNGIDIKRTTYATIMYIINRGDSESGGGSTITQQLIKNIKNDKADSGSKGI